MNGKLKVPRAAVEKYSDWWWCGIYAGPSPDRATDATSCGIPTMYIVLDWTFFVLHGAFILFNMVGWAWQRTRVLHLITLALTTFSWFVMGMFWGWGYCVLTDWHTHIRRQLAYAEPEATFAQQFAGRLCGLPLDRTFADCITGSIFTFIVVVTAITWSRKRFSKRP